jgi:excisionase family DNA binding protein
MDPANNSSAIAHTTSEAARMLGIGKTKLFELIGSGELRSIQIGTRRLVPDAELRAFVERQLQEVAKDRDASQPVANGRGQSRT